MNVMKSLCAAIVLCAVSPAALAAPGDMSVANFLTNANALKTMGMRAMFSSELKVVIAESKAAGQAYRARLAADRAAGRPPHSCPPAKAKIKSDQVMAHLESYPVAQRPTITMKMAMADMFAKNYPCPR